tara:strand:- start:456 stop:779 length:324 start_codon:yes stop_codon:yes gene_type:complete
MKVLLTTIALLISTTCFCQITAVHFNADWNSGNDVEWFNKLADVELSTKDISIADVQAKFKIAVVPTIIVFDDGEEVKRFQADLSFKMVSTKKEIQEYIDELIISKF